jgi:immunity protein 27 of polymorphic toxin system
LKKPEGGMSGREINDPALIQKLSGERLTLVRTDQSGWITLYRDKETGRFWELDYPNSEMHGGGPPRLRELNIVDPSDWEVSN